MKYFHHSYRSSRQPIIFFFHVLGNVFIFRYPPVSRIKGQLKNNHYNDSGAKWHVAMGRYVFCALFFLKELLQSTFLYFIQIKTYVPFARDTISFLRKGTKCCFSEKERWCEQVLYWLLKKRFKKFILDNASLVRSLFHLNFFWKTYYYILSELYLWLVILIKKGLPPCSRKHLSSSSKHVHIVSVVVESFGIPHRRSHSTSCSAWPSHHSRSSGKTWRKVNLYSLCHFPNIQMSIMCKLCAQ